MIDGPFTETRALIAGLWLRQVVEAADSGAEFTPELQTQQDRLRERIAARARPSAA